jgi:hypothetical protein
MKALRQLLCAIVLSCVLSASAFAGEGIVYPFFQPTPTPTPSPDEPVAARMAPESNEGESDVITVIVLDVLTNIIRLF